VGPEDPRQSEAERPNGAARAPFRSFERDAAGERAIAALRIAGAIGVLAGAGWLVAVHPSPRAVAFAVLGAIVGLAWIGAFVRGRRRARERVALHLRPDALVIEVSGEECASIPWSQVRRIRVDEERLVVRVEREGNEPLVVEPLWRGVGVHDLARAIDHARAAALSGSGGSGTGRREAEHIDPPDTVLPRAR
jgi:hypothetical protein